MSWTQIENPAGTRGGRGEIKTAKLTDTQRFMFRKAHLDHLGDPEAVDIYINTESLDHQGEAMIVPGTTCRVITGGGKSVPFLTTIRALKWVEGSREVDIVATHLNGEPALLVSNPHR